MSLWTLCLPDVLSFRMFSYRRFVPRTLRYVSGCYVAGRFVSGHFVTLDVLSPDVLSGHQFNYRRTYDLCLKKLPNLGILINSLVYFTGKSILNTNYFENIQKKIKIISEHAYWDQGKLFDEETGDKNLVTLSL